MIVIINGQPRVGKDTFANYLQSNLPKKKIINTSSIETIKKIATRLGWDGTKDEKDRKFLSDLKIAWTKYNDGPLNEMLCLEKSYDVVITQIREISEIEKVKEKCEKCITILITSDKKLETFDNVGDKDTLIHYKYDYVLFNKHDDLTVLEKATKQLIREII